MTDFLSRKRIDKILEGCDLLNLNAVKDRLIQKLITQNYHPQPRFWG